MAAAKGRLLRNRGLAGTPNCEMTRRRRGGVAIQVQIGSLRRAACARLGPAGQYADAGASQAAKSSSRRRQLTTAAYATATATATAAAQARSSARRRSSAAAVARSVPHAVAPAAGCALAAGPQRTPPMCAPAPAPVSAPYSLRDDDHQIGGGARLIGDGFAPIMAPTACPHPQSHSHPHPLPLQHERARSASRRPWLVPFAGAQLAPYALAVCRPSAADDGAQDPDGHCNGAHKMHLPVVNGSIVSRAPLGFTRPILAPTTRAPSKYCNDNHDDHQAAAAAAAHQPANAILQARPIEPPRSHPFEQPMREPRSQRRPNVRPSACNGRTSIGAQCSRAKAPPAKTLTSIARNPTAKLPWAVYAPHARTPARAARSCTLSDTKRLRHGHSPSPLYAASHSRSCGPKTDPTPLSLTSPQHHKQFQVSRPMNQRRPTDACLIKSRSQIHHWVWDELEESCEYLVSPKRDEVLFHPECSKSTAAIRGSQPLTKNGNYYFWEVTIFDRSYGTSIMFGVCTKEQSLYKSDYCNLIGLDENGWSLSHKGLVSHNGVSLKYMEPFPAHSSTTVGLLYDSTRGELSFFINGTNRGVAFRGLDQVKSELYPVIGSTAKGTRIKLEATYCGYMSLLERSRVALLEKANNKLALVEYLYQSNVPRHLIDYLIDAGDP